MAFAVEAKISRFYCTLRDTWGRQNWWPAESRFEVMVGALLTQNTSWVNVERALENLRAAGVLSLEGIRETELAELEILLRPSGYFRQKARRLKDLVTYVGANGLPEEAALERLFKQPTEKLRGELLEQKGIGPETADSIVLYAADHPTFVVDAYTRRVFERHGLVPAGAGYETIRLLVERALASPPAKAKGRTGQPEGCFRPKCHAPSSISAASRTEVVQRYNEFHALLVQVGKHYCLKAAPRCEGCPLARFL